jgi:phage protein D
MATMGPRRARAFYQVTVNGQDVTAKFDPYLIALTVVDYEMAMDTCTIELDDSNGVLALPPDNAPITISLGWADEGLKLVFKGKVSDVSSMCQRTSGRRLKIEGVGADVFGQGKTPTSKEWGEGVPANGEAKQVTAKTVLEEAAKNAGYTFTGAEDICNIARSYWSQNNESFHSFAHRLAGELGGTLKISGDQVSLTSNTNNVNAQGKKMADVVCAWGSNLIAWNIHPKSGRPIFAETAAAWFDDKAGKWEMVKKVVGGAAAGLTKAIHFNLMPMATKDQAERQAQTDAAASLRATGYGWAVVNGEPAAAAGSNAILKGTRAGVDGQYRITEAEHSLNRKQGYTTRLTLAQPGPTVGQDFRGDFQR